MANSTSEPTVPVTSERNEDVRSYWEQEPRGPAAEVTGDRSMLTRDWFERLERQRYEVEPFIHSFAQFTRHHGQKVLEVGVGAGTDHLQWARAGADLHGVDLTDTAIETTRARLREYGFSSHLQRVDAERLPFENAAFDVVYSWGGIHHSENPGLIIAETRRILKPGGEFIGMFYGRHSLVALKLWVRLGLLSGKPWRSLADVVSSHMESVGTKSYTSEELRELFRGFSDVHITPIVTDYDRRYFPKWATGMLPSTLGWFLAVRAVR